MRPQPSLLLVPILPSRPPFSSCMGCSFVGDLRCFADALPPDSSRAAHRFAYLGNPYRSASVAVSIDSVGKLAGRPRWYRAIPGRIPAPLSGQACLSRHFRQCAHHRRGNRLRRKSCVLRSTSLDQPARSSLTAFRFIHADSPRRQRFDAVSLRTAAGIPSSLLQEFIRKGAGVHANTPENARLER